jgi:hypothetical protein
MRLHGTYLVKLCMLTFKQTGTRLLPSRGIQSTNIVEISRFLKSTLASKVECSGLQMSLAVITKDRCTYCELVMLCMEVFIQSNDCLA